MGDVPLRDFIERIIKEHERRRDDLRIEDHRRIDEAIKNINEKFDTSVANVRAALKLQAIEYERRLADLNHAHAEATRVLGTYLPRELYERSHQEVIEWQRKADVRWVELESRLKSVELGLVNLPGGIKSLELGLAAQAGTKVGERMTTTTAIALAGLAFVILAGLVAVLNYFGK